MFLCLMKLINAILKYEENGELKSLRGLHKRNLGDLGIEIVSNFIINDKKGYLI